LAAIAAIALGFLILVLASGPVGAQETVPEAPPPPPADEVLEVSPAAAATIEDPVPSETSDTQADTAAVNGETANAGAAQPTRTLAELDMLRLPFGAGSAELSDDAKEDLLALSGYLEVNQTARVELLAYAAPTDGVGSRARWLSLSRALAVRGFLVDKGIRLNRIDLRPLGKEAVDGPPDRVDVVPARR
jgi:outer membrane protein OmpA-like peptidoglycan-associated protein